MLSNNRDIIKLNVLTSVITRTLYKCQRFTLNNNRDNIKTQRFILSDNRDIIKMSTFYPPL